MASGVSNLMRLFAIARTLARHDALWPMERMGVAKPALLLARPFRRKKPGLRQGERLANALADLGPTFIKLGQALSVRSDLVGEEVATDLARLQDNLPPFPFEKARAEIEAELEAPLEDLFSVFDEKPVAAASIAQVHFATTTDGREVAVKVLRPDIERKFERDLDLFYWLAEMVERVAPAMRRLRPVDVVRTFEEWARVEMDLRLEGAAASELADNCVEDDGFRVPRVDWQRTGTRVLTTERVHGIRIDDVAAITAAGLDVNEVLERSARVFFLQVFRDGFFHADMHPGNMFVDADGTLVPVDFGIMGRVDRKTRYFLADMLIGFLSRDYDRVADVHFDAGLVPPHKSRDAFKQAIRAIGEPLFDRPLSEISIGRLLQQLFQTTESFDMETQPDLLLLQKTMLVAEGVGRRLNPDVNMWFLARPLIEDWMLANRGPEARLREAASNIYATLERLPGVLSRAETLIDRLSSEETGNRKYYRKPDPHGPKQHRSARRPSAAAILALGFSIAAFTLAIMDIFR